MLRTGIPTEADKEEDNPAQAGIPDLAFGQRYFVGANTSNDNFMHSHHIDF